MRSCGLVYSRKVVRPIPALSACVEECVALRPTALLKRCDLGVAVGGRWIPTGAESLRALPWPSIDGRLRIFWISWNCVMFLIVADGGLRVGWCVALLSCFSKLGISLKAHAPRDAPTVASSSWIRPGTTPAFSCTIDTRMSGVF